MLSHLCQPWIGGEAIGPQEPSRLGAWRSLIRRIWTSGLCSDLQPFPRGLFFFFFFHFLAISRPPLSFLTCDLHRILPSTRTFPALGSFLQPEKNLFSLLDDIFSGDLVYLHICLSSLCSASWPVWSDISTAFSFGLWTSGHRTRTRRPRHRKDSKNRRRAFGKDGYNGPGIFRLFLISYAIEISKVSEPKKQANPSALCSNGNTSV